MVSENLVYCLASASYPVSGTNKIQTRQFGSKTQALNYCTECHSKGSFLPTMSLIPSKTYQLKIVPQLCFDIIAFFKIYSLVISYLKPRLQGYREHSMNNLKRNILVP